MTNQKAKIDARKRLFATRFKTEMCRTFTTEGACPYGPKCMFAHGPDDLRTEALNTAEGLTSSNAVRQWLRRSSNGSFYTPSDTAHSMPTPGFNSLPIDYLNAVPSLGESPSYLLTGELQHTRSPMSHPMPTCWRMQTTESLSYSSPDRIQSMPLPYDAPAHCLAAPFGARSAPSQEECWRMSKPSLRPYRHDPYSPAVVGLTHTDSWSANYVAT